jgi:hypothetical protein
MRESFSQRTTAITSGACNVPFAICIDLQFLGSLRRVDLADAGLQLGIRHACRTVDRVHRQRALMTDSDSELQGTL